MDNMLIRRLERIIDSEYPDKGQVYLDNVVKRIEQLLEVSIDKNILKNYLIEKGFKHIEEDISKASPSMEDIFNMDSIELFNSDIDFDAFYENQEGKESSFDNIENIMSQVYKNKYTFNDNKFLVSKYKQTKDKETLNQLIAVNKNLVVKYASFYSRFLTGSAVSYDDLLQVGYLGLIKAIDNFDVTYNSELSTYATHWIKQYITREIADKDGTIRLPVHVIETLRKLRVVENKYQHLKGDTYIEKVCEDLAISREKYFYLKNLHCTFLERLVSLETPVGENKDVSVKELTYGMKTYFLIN